VRQSSQTKNDYLLDTSVVIEIIKQNTAIIQRAAAAGSLYLSVIAYGELLYGAKHSNDPAKGRADVINVVQKMTLLVTDDITAEIFGDIKHDLRTKGHMIPDNDIWIAATARQYNLTLATRDAHFSNVTRLSFALW